MMRDHRWKRSEKGTRIPPEVLDAPVRGRNLAGATVGENLDKTRTLLVFLRHLG